jgi:heat shock protein HspQ
MPATSSLASFHLGQIVRHKEFGYRGVVYDVDPAYQGSDAWFDRNAGAQPASKEAPWYYVIVDEEEGETYVPEQHLEADESGEPVWHPELDDLFGDVRNGS